MNRCVYVWTDANRISLVNDGVQRPERCGPLWGEKGLLLGLPAFHYAGIIFLQQTQEWLHFCSDQPSSSFYVNTRMKDLFFFLVCIINRNMLSMLDDEAGLLRCFYEGVALLMGVQHRAAVLALQRGGQAHSWWQQKRPEPRWTVRSNTLRGKTNIDPGTV